MSAPPALPDAARAAGFAWPRDYLRVWALGLPGLPPWVFHSGEEVREHARGLAERYPERRLIPFARREDCDDVACFELGGLHPVALIHDYASAGWEGQAGCSFRAWLRDALEDYLDEPSGS